MPVRDIVILRNYRQLFTWRENLRWDTEVYAALRCIRKILELRENALHRNYIQTVAEAWFKNDIKTYNDLDKYYQKQEKLNTLQKTISKKLGLTRHLSQYEEGYIEKWNIDYGYNLDVIELALKKTTSKANPNFDYLDKLLTDWHDRNFKTTNDVQNFLLQMKEKNKNIKTLEKNTGYSNYDQRNYNDLNNFYANNTKLDN